jgi:L-ribulose-5-phosphate 3-epimerase UlaE
MPIKDFNWVKTNGKWKPKNVPLGEGMVDFDGYFKELRSYGIRPLVSLHLEYELGELSMGTGRSKFRRRRSLRP